MSARRVVLWHEALDVAAGGSNADAPLHRILDVTGHVIVTHRQLSGGIVEDYGSVQRPR